MAVISYKCPNCGGELVFEPSSQKYACPYCRSSFAVEEIESPMTEDKPEDSESHAEEDSREEAAWYSCPSCGAQLVTDATTAATFCYFCHNPVVLQGRLSGEYLPAQIIPFRLDREKALVTFRSFVSGKWFVPKEFYQESSIEKLTGVYYPYWKYDTRLASSFHAKGHKTRVWMMGDTEYTETSIYQIERTGDVSISDLTRNALRGSEKYDRNLVEKVQPYDLQDLKPFRMGYLSGFFAEKRDMEKAEFQNALETETQDYARKTLRDSAGKYAVISNESFRSDISRADWNYILLPVWVLTYRGNNDKIYYFAMNGQNGKICGELPVDNRKLALYAGLIGMVVLILMLMGGYLL